MKKPININSNERWFTRIAAIALGLLYCAALVSLILTPDVRDELAVYSGMETVFIGFFAALCITVAGFFVYIGFKGRTPVWFSGMVESEDAKHVESSRIRRIITGMILYLPLFGGLLGVGIILPVLENTISIDWLLLIAVAIGLLAVVILIPFEAYARVKKAERWGVRGIFALGVIASAITIIGYSNYRFASNNADSIEVLVLDKEYNAHPEQWRMLVEVNGHKDWISVNCPLWQDSEVDQQQQLQIHRGYWGLSVVRKNAVPEPAMQPAPGRCS